MSRAASAPGPAASPVVQRCACQDEEIQRSPLTLPTNAAWSRLAVGQAFPRTPVRVGAVDDPLEREAEHVAEAVVRDHEVTDRLAPSSSRPTSRAADSALGQPLSLTQRAYFEPHFGDLSAVRLHTGPRAEQAAAELSARAFAVGKDIAFGAGQFQPDSRDGRKLLAHELAHTVQQGAAGVVRRIPEDVAEAQELGNRIRALSDEALAAALDELYRRAGAEGRGRTGEGTPDAPFEDYARALRRQAPAPLSGLGLLAPGGPETPPLRPADPLAALEAAPRLLESSTDSAARLLPLLEAEARRRLASAENARRAGGWFDLDGSESWLHTADGAARIAASVEVRSRLAAVPVPTRSGHLRRSGRGRVYTAARDRATRHEEFLARGDEVLGLSTPEERRRWELFEFVMRTEGDTSAVNAYDDQIVTFGAGFSGRSGRMGRLFRQMPRAFQEELFRHGIALADDASFIVLEDGGVILRDDDALRALRRDERRLSLLINLAQSETILEEDGESRPAREWMLKNQLDRLAIPADVVADWPLSTAKLAVKMNHWQPAVATWDALRRWSARGTDIHAMARGARDAIWEFHGRQAIGAYSRMRIERRFRRRAVEAGAGRLEL